jgi:hypothetical protein
LQTPSGAAENPSGHLETHLLLLSSKYGVVQFVQIPRGDEHTLQLVSEHFTQVPTLFA